MTAVWLLPIVAAEVAAASGGLLIGHLEAGVPATRILFISYALLGMSLFPAIGILVILFLRMALHKLPKREMAASSWLSLGPIATGALGMLLLGEQAPLVLTAVWSVVTGRTLHGAYHGYLFVAPCLSGDASLRQPSAVPGDRGDGAGASVQSRGLMRNARCVLYALSVGKGHQNDRECSCRTGELDFILSMS